MTIRILTSQTLITLLLLLLSLPGLAQEDTTPAAEEPVAQYNGADDGAETEAEEADTQETADADQPDSGEQEIEDSAEPQEHERDLSAEPEQQYSCFVSGEPWNLSPTRVEVIFIERGQLKRARFLNMAFFLGALADFQQQGRALNVRQVKVVDYNSVRSGAPRMIELDRESGASNVWFVLGTSKIEHTRPPYVLAFDNELSADEYLSNREGKKLTYTKLIELVGEHLGAEQPR